MKTLFTTVCLLLAITSGFGQRYSISKVTTTPVSPARLQPGEAVAIGFSYSKPTGDVLIFVRPMYRGSLASHYTAAGGSAHSANTGTGTSDFTINATGRVDQLRFQFVTPLTQNVLYEDFVDVSFEFLEYDIFDVVFTPPSPGSLAINQRVNVTYSYFKPAGNVRIYLMPMFNGGQARGYGVPGSDQFSENTGSTDGYFQLNQPGQVDQLRFRIMEARGLDILYETFVPVDFSWVDYSISDIVIDPGSPATLITGTPLTINFNYSKPDGEVRIFVRPMYGGSLADDYIASGGALYSASSGSGSSDFHLASPGAVDQIRFRFTSVPNDEILAEVFFNVDYTWVDYLISDVVFDPPSPASTGINQPVNVTFNYSKKAGDVTIFTMPMSGGGEAPGYGHSASPLYTENSDSGTSFFTLTQPGHVDQVRFWIMDPTASTVLLEVFYDVDYSWIGYEITDITFDRVSPAAVAVRQEIFVTFNYSKPDGDIRIFVRGRYEGADAAEFYYEGSPLYTENSGSGGSHFFLSIPGKIDQLRFRVADAAGNDVLYETFADVDFSWVDYQISDVVFTPASPAILQTGNRVNVNFNYAKPDGDVRIFVRPYYDGALAVSYNASGAELYTDNGGSGVGDFTLNAAGSVDYVKIYITDNLPEYNVLHEQFFPVDFTFVPGSGIDTGEVIDGVSIYPLPCRERLTISVPAAGKFRYGIYTVQGSLVVDGIALSDTVTVEMDQLPQGTYLVRVTTDKKVISRILVKE
jgi:hypothetical protein